MSREKILAEIQSQKHVLETYKQEVLVLLRAIEVDLNKLRDDVQVNFFGPPRSMNALTELHLMLGKCMGLDRSIAQMLILDEGEENETLLRERKISGDAKRTGVHSLPRKAG